MSCSCVEGCSLIKLNKCDVEGLILPDISIKEKYKFLKRQPNLENLE